jgi:3-methyladenine DNA glycosylase AlkD
MNKLAALLLLASLMSVGLAWWDKGHMLISQIAYNHLTDLGATSIRDKFNALITAFNTLTDGRTNTFTEAAVWPDDIKTYNAHQFDNYHFTNMYLPGDSVPTTPTSCSRA